jgi:multidrug efflux system membrane fusion protein
MSTTPDTAKEPAPSQPRQPGSPPPMPNSAAHKPSKSSTATLAIVLIACFAALIVLIYFMRHNSSVASAKKGAGGRGGTNGPPVPVTAGVVAKKDMPIYLEGVGTVQAFNTVTVRARVDGQIEKIAFVEGQDVRTGDLLAQIDPAPFRTALDQAVAKKGQDEAQLANARVDLKRYADLLANEGVTEQQYDTQKALVDQLVATVKADEAAIESAKVQLDYTTIVSPLDGRTGIRLVDQGNIVHATDMNGIVVLTQLKPISLVFTLTAQQFARIQEQSDNTDLTVLAMDQDNTNVIAQGKLSVIDNQIDPTTASIKLKATFANNDLKLWPGEFVNARLLLTTRKDSAVVPAQVIQRGPDGSFAFVINDDQTVDMRPVKVALIEDGEAIVSHGLEPGEKVVVDGQYKLQKGSRVKADQSGGQQQPGGAADGSKKKGKGKKKQADSAEASGTS